MKMTNTMRETMKRKNKIRFSSRANRNPEATGREKHRTGKKKKKGGRGRRREAYYL